MSTNDNKQIQHNTYVVYDSMGRRTDIYIVASNLAEACKEAKKTVPQQLKSNYYKVKRMYNGGVRGQL
jgi:hypothetical protein